MTILNLPNELLLQIVETLTRDGEVYAVALTNRRLAAIAIPILHKLALQDKDGLTALQWAAFECAPSHEGLVRLLLAKGVDIDYFEPCPFNYRTHNYEPTLHYKSSPAIHRAVIAGNVAVLRILLEHGANVNIKNAYGDIALHWALEFNRKEEITLVLLENGADVLTPIDDEDRSTLLQKAVKKSTYAVVAKILERGVNVNDRGNNGETALHSAAQTTEACKDSRISLIRLLFENGADASVQDNFGITPLHCAAATGSEMAIRLLLEKGAKVDAVSDLDRTPLSTAVLWRRDTAIEALLEAGADILFTRRNGDTVVEAIAGGALEVLPNARIIRLILEKPEQFKKYIGSNPDGGKVMDWAIGVDCVDLVNLFLDNGLDISVQRKDLLQNERLPLFRPCPSLNRSCEGTALHWAAKYGSEEVASLLLKRGADTEIKAKCDKRTALEWALEWAISNKKPQMVELFFKNRRGIDAIGTEVSKKASGRKSNTHENSFSRYPARLRQFLRF